eukprot:748523-Hanusia_phi.AAC.3
MTEILVEVYPADSENMAAEVFTEINKAEPCKLVDLPQAKVPVQTKKIIDGASEKLRQRYSAMFKESGNPRVQSDMLTAFPSNTCRRLDACGSQLACTCTKIPQRMGLMESEDEDDGDGDEGRGLCWTPQVHHVDMVRRWWLSVCRRGTGRINLDALHRRAVVPSYHLEVGQRRDRQAGGMGGWREGGRREKVQSRGMMYKESGGKGRMKQAGARKDEEGERREERGERYEMR